MTISLQSRFMSQPMRMNSAASQSSNSGARPLALHAEVLGRFHHPDAEELLPEAVHRDARGQRILGRDEPLRQGEPVRGRAGRQRRQAGGCGRGSPCPRLVVEPLDQDEGVARLRHVLHHHHTRDGAEVCDRSSIPFRDRPACQRSPRRWFSKCCELLVRPESRFGGPEPESLHFLG